LALISPIPVPAWSITCGQAMFAQQAWDTAHFVKRNVAMAAES